MSKSGRLLDMPQSPALTIAPLRERAGLTAEQLAVKANVSPGYLSKVETGKCAPSNFWLSRVITVIATELVASTNGA